MNRSNRINRHKSLRKKIVGTDKRPRLAVFRSNQHIYAQIIDDSLGKTLVFESDLKIKEGNKTQKAKKVGENLAQKAKLKKIDRVVFDRGGFKFHGRIAGVAEGAKETGLKF